MARTRTESALPQRRITSLDVAREAGVSRTLVSYVLNNVEGVKIREETRRTILEAAARIRYRPNQSARAIRTGRFRCLALLLGSRYYLPAELLGGLYRATTRRDLHLTVAALPEEKLINAEQAPKILRELLADGMLINTNVDTPPLMYDRLEEFRIPGVTINSKRAHDCVYPDDWAAARRAVAVLAGLGHRRIVFANFSGTGPHYSVADREGGYREEMTAAGLTPHSCCPDRVKDAAARVAQAVKLLRARQRPEAVVAYSYPTAAALHTAALTLGLHVPEDLSILTFDNRPFDYLGVPMSTLEIPWDTVAENAVDLILAKIEAPSRKIPARAVAYGWEARGGTCAPPACRN